MLYKTYITLDIGDLNLKKYNIQDKGDNIMKIVSAKPFTYRGGNKAVLLLHGFTGNTRDVKNVRPVFT
ncbi:hypothetical protein GCM10020331_005760 [Ectobacillus funiculus]